MTKIKHRERKEKNTLIVLGYDALMPKLFYPNKSLSLHLYEQIFFIGRNPHQLLSVSENQFIKSIDRRNPASTISQYYYSIFAILVNFSNVRPAKIKFALFFNEKHIILMSLFPLAFFFVLLGSTTIIVCRGSEIGNWDKHNFLSKLCIKLYGVLASKVFVRDPSINMPIIDKFKIFRFAKVETEPNVLPKLSDDSYNELCKVKNIPERPKLLFFNSLKKWRNPSFSVQVLSDLADNRYTLTIAGYRSGVDDQEVYLIESLIKHHGLQDRVNIESFSTNFRQKISNYDAFLLPATIIYCNNSLIECMHNGLIPFVLGKDPFTPLIVENEVNGFVIDALDSKLWAEKIKVAFSDQSHFDALRLNAIKHIQDNFTIDL